MGRRRYFLVLKAEACCAGVEPAGCARPVVGGCLSLVMKNLGVGGAEKMAQWLKAWTALAEEFGF